MASPALPGRLDPKDLQGEDGNERLVRVLNGVTDHAAALADGAIRYRLYTTPYLYVNDGALPLGKPNGPALLNDFRLWTDTTFISAALSKDPSGRVWIQGALMLSPTVALTAGLPICALPRGYAPALGWGPLPAISNGAAASFDVTASGYLRYVSGGAAGQYIVFNQWWVASDRSPLPAACWPYRITLDQDVFSSQPKAVVLAQVRERDTNAKTVAGTVDWEYTTVGSSPVVSIRNVPFLAPGKWYSFTFLVIAG